MDQQTFLNTLREKLSDSGISQEAVERHIGQFDRYFAALSPDELDKQLKKLSDVDSIVQSICILYQPKADNGSAETDTEQTTNHDNENNNLSFNESGDVESEKEALTPSATPENDNFTYAESDTENPEIRVINDKKEHSHKSKDANSTQKNDIHESKAVDSSSEAPIKEYPHIDINALDYDSDAPTDEKKKRESVKGTPLFWSVFLLTSPIWGTLVLAVYAMIFAVLAVLAISVVVMILLLAAVVITGTALSLYGIIYGIIQTFTTLAPGLFDIGLGIIIGGATMLCGILIYNAAIRFMPFAIKKLSKLLPFYSGKLGDLFYYLKKECGRS